MLGDITDCKIKHRFSDYETAKESVDHSPNRLKPYKCLACGGWHVTGNNVKRGYQRNTRRGWRSYKMDWLGKI